MRTLLVLLHRWIGLATAAFLFVAGLTGAVISWDHELDEWLNPHLFKTQSIGTPQAALTLADTLEARDPRLQVSYLPLSIEAGHSLPVWVQPRLAEPGKAHVLAFNQVALDPVTGETLGQRLWGELGLGREQIMPFLYKLHYSLHLPDGFGLELGVLFMGIVAIFWCFDSLVALWLSFPNRRAWRKSFAFRWRQGGYKLNFDLHRSGGVWIWPLLLMLAVTSVSMNLNFQVMRPLVEVFSSLTPSPFASRAPVSLDEQRPPEVTRREVLQRAEQEAARLALADPAGSIFYSPEFHLYAVAFFQPGLTHGDGGLGNPTLYFDASSGALVGRELPGSGTAGDIFMQAQFPLHSGRILGVPGRILVSLLGLAVAMLSVTGVVIWAKKRTARQRQAAMQGTLSLAR